MAVCSEATGTRPGLTVSYIGGVNSGVCKTQGHRGAEESSAEQEDPYQLMMNVIVCNRDVQPMAAECHRQLMSPHYSVCLLPPGARQGLTNGMAVKDINCG